MSLRLFVPQHRRSLAAVPICRISTLRHHFNLNLHLRHRHASSSKPRLDKSIAHSKPPPTSYQKSSRQPRPLPEDPPSESAPVTRRTKRRLRPYIVVACLFVFTTSAYIGLLYAQLRSEPAASADPSEQDNSLTLRYDTTASDYDAVVDSSEYWQGITRLRRELVGLARGRVLEVCAGTGRNLAFYDFGEKRGWAEGMLGKGGAMKKKKRDKSIAAAGGEEGVVEEEGEEEGSDDTVTELICIDRSAAMLDIARAKWAKLHPLPPPPPPPPPQNQDLTNPSNQSPKPEPETSAIFKKTAFLTQTATAPFPPPPPPPSTTSPSSAQTPKDTEKEKFNTIIQTFGLCSLPSPTLHLLHLATLLTAPSPKSKDSKGGQLLLLEHGRSHLPWINTILDRSAKRHAERHGCWYNRDIGRILAECEEAGILVVEEIRRPWWGGGTVWFVRARVGPALYH